MSAPMKRFRKLPIQVKACQFTRQMAEGSKELPENVKYISRRIDEEGDLVHHEHRIEDTSIEVGSLVVQLPSGRTQIVSPDVFESVYRPMRDVEAGPAQLAYGQYSAQLVVNLKSIGIEPENDAHRQEILTKADQFIAWVLRHAMAEAALGR